MTEDYKPQRHEFGTPESSKWAKSMTPGQEGSTGIPDGKARMKFKSVRTKKDQVKETASGMSFFQYREQLSEDVSHRMMKRKIKYSSTPGRPGKRVSAPTKALLKGLSSYNSRAEAAKAKGLFKQAKEVWEVTLHTMDTRMYVRELLRKGNYIYFFSFDGDLPHMLSTSEKRVTKRDWAYLGDEYQFMTFHTFGKYYVPEKQEGEASVRGGTEPTEKTMRDVPEEYLTKTPEELEKMIGKSKVLTEFFASISLIEEIEETLMELLSLDPDGLDNEKFLMSFKEKLFEEYNDETYGKMFVKSLKSVLRSARGGSIKMKVTADGDNISISGKKIGKDKEPILSLAWFKDHVYCVKDALGDEYITTTAKPPSDNDLQLIKAWWKVRSKTHVPDIQDMSSVKGENDLNAYLQSDKVDLDKVVTTAIDNTTDKQKAEIKIELGTEGIDPSYVPPQWKPENIGPSYTMKGGGSESFTLSNYHKKSFTESYIYKHPEDGSMIRFSGAFRRGSGGVDAPSIKELLKKLDKDGGFNSEKWDDFDFYEGFDGGHGGDMEILQGPKGIVPDSEAYEEWEERVNDAGEGDLEEELGFEHWEHEGYEIWGPVLIEDDEGNQLVYDPGMEIDVKNAMGNDIRVTFDSKVSNKVMSEPPATPFEEDEEEAKEGWRKVPPKAEYPGLTAALKKKKFFGYGDYDEDDPEAAMLKFVAKKDPSVVDWEQAGVEYGDVKGLNKRDEYDLPVSIYPNYEVAGGQFVYLQPKMWLKDESAGYLTAYTMGNEYIYVNGFNTMGSYLVPLKNDEKKMAKDEDKITAALLWLDYQGEFK
jgi:hypothetical protein